LPSNYISRHELLEELVSAVMTTETEPDRFGSTVTITGVGGFGKSVLAKALCHHATIKAKFKSGFIFVELGPKACDPVVELHQLYYLLTGKEFPASQSNTTNIIKEIRQVTCNHCNELLVIIDDVWHAEDAEPIVEAFNNCKTIVTTRKNEISQLIPSKCNITAGPMRPHEAISLLTTGVVLQTQLSGNDCISLDNIAHDVHLWPLLLSLVRGQLSHYINLQKMPLSEALGMVHQKLYAKGLTAFDRNNLGNNISNRKNAVKACVETTLDLLQKSDSDKIKVTILYGGIGCPILTSTLHIIWKVSQLEANDIMTTLWGHGLVTYGSSVVPCFVTEQRHIEIHVTISQFIIETIQSEEVIQLTPYIGSKSAMLSVGGELAQEFHRCCGSLDIFSLNDQDFLKHWHNLMEYGIIPYRLKQMNVWAIFDPHKAIHWLLEPMFKALQTIGLTNFSLNAIMSSFSSQVTTLIEDCRRIVRDTCRSRKTLYQLAMKHLVEKNYDGLLQELEDYCKHYPMGAVAEKGVKLINEVMPYCQLQGDYMLNSCFKNWLEGLQLLTVAYHFNTLLLFPLVKTNISLCKRISNSLESSNSIEIKQVVDYIKSGKQQEDWELIEINHLIKIQEVAPNTLQLMSTK